MEPFVPPLTDRLELPLVYSHRYGALAPFFAALREGRLVGTQCDACGRRWCPPRHTCRCGAAVECWIDMPATGTIAAITRGPRAQDSGAAAGSVDHALVQVEGAANRMFAGVLDPSLRAGERVELVRHVADDALLVTLAVFGRSGT